MLGRFCILQLLPFAFQDLILPGSNYCIARFFWFPDSPVSAGLCLQFLQMGAFPVFVVDGEPSPLKSQARAARFFRGSGMDLAALPSTEADSSAAAVPVKRRNAAFTRCVEECVVSSRVSAMPVILRSI